MIIIDDVLSPTSYQHLYERWMSPMMQWAFIPEVSGSKHNQSSGFHPAFGETFEGRRGGDSTASSGMSHVFLQDGNVNVQHTFEMSFPVLANAIDKAGIGLQFCLNGRAFTTIPQPSLPDPKTVAHTDTNDPHWVCLYYLTNHTDDPSSNTLLFSGKYDENRNIIGEFEQTDSVEAKANRAIIFDGSTIHAGGWPTKNRRTILNFNFLRNDV